MKIIQLAVSVCLFPLLFACAKHKASDYEALAMDSTSTEGFVSTAAFETGKDSARKVVRAADIKCKVKDVATATYVIEQTVKVMGGFVTNTELASNPDYPNTVLISPDSSLVTTRFTVTNNMTIRVPNTQLDDVLKALAQMVTYLDHRTIKAEDVSLQLIANQMTLSRASKHGKRITSAIDNKGHKLNDILTAEESLAYGQSITDEAKISTLSLKDKVQYSTIQLVLYQNQTVHEEVVYTPSSPKPYEPNLFLKLGNALLVGWGILEAILVFFTQLWEVFLIGLVGFLLFRTYKLRFVK